MMRCRKAIELASNAAQRRRARGGGNFGRMRERERKLAGYFLSGWLPKRRAGSSGAQRASKEVRQESRKGKWRKREKRRAVKMMLRWDVASSDGRWQWWPPKQPSVCSFLLICFFCSVKLNLRHCTTFDDEYKKLGAKITALFTLLGKFITFRESVWIFRELNFIFGFSKKVTVEVIFRFKSSAMILSF